MLPVISENSTTVIVLTINASEVHMQSVDGCGAVQGKSINKALQYKNPGLLFRHILPPFFHLTLALPQPIP